MPVIYVIENNVYSISTSLSLERSSAFKNCLAARAEGYNIEWDQINGEDIYEVPREAAEEPLNARIMNRARPYWKLIPYRYYGHSVADANAKKYRDPEEIEKYKKFHDPLQLWQKRLTDEGVINEEQIAALDAEAKRRAEAP